MAAAPPPHASPWAGWWNAEVYDAFSREHRIYRALNWKLVALARIGSARRVLDLACGAGATARACLERLPARGELVGVDASEAMVEVARTRVRDPRARFVVAPASGFEAAVSGRFDRAVCNAAFWQFPDRRAVLAALARRLDEGALFVFNVPEERLRPVNGPARHPSEEHDPESATPGPAAATATVGCDPVAPAGRSCGLGAASGPGVTPFQVALARAVEERTGAPPPGSPPLDPERLETRLREAGFTPLARERFTYAGHQRELMELMAIPAMIARLAPTLPPPERDQVLERARRHVDPEQPVRIPWIYFVARREGPETAQATDRPLGP